MNDLPQVREKGAARFLPDPVVVIVVCAIGLTILGLTILFSASASFKQGPYFYLNKQLLGIGGAIALCITTVKVNLDQLRKYVWYILGALLFLLFLVLIPHIGIRVNGSRRWLGVGSLRVQISEFAKFGMVFCLAHYLALQQTKLKEWKLGFLYPAGIILSFSILIICEPDFGTTALVIAVGATLFFLAGAKWIYTVPSILLVLLAFVLLVMHNPNRQRRLLAYMDVEANKKAGTYQLYQSLAAFAAGGVNGEGLGQGRQQSNFLPEAHTDFILAVVGEELGLWYTGGIVGLYTIIFIAGYLHVRRAPNLFHFLLATGCVLLICYQAISNIGVVTGVFPTKGMSLPFISAGLSNLLLMGILLGVLINTSRNWSRTGLNEKKRHMQEVVA
ncbi:MAG: putative peptidoglycan glycosyltransferase FtsW [Verrucomicrobiota bacterium]|jgi:cell division protein FtsW|nr:MAG: cell division protein FtsW [Verrucomicrobiota bacterium]